MTVKLADRIEAERERQFVGRTDELGRFSRWVASEDRSQVVLQVHGPGGVGKTSLLRRFESACSALEIPFRTLDARSMQPTPASVQATFVAATGAEDLDRAFASGADAARQVLFIDTYEAIEPLDGWIRDHFIPQLSANTIVVLLGRKRPASGWKSGGWQKLTATMPLRNLDDEDVRTFLDRQSVPSHYHESILRFTHGFPLAMCLVTDTFAQQGRIDFVGESTPDVLWLLVERFLEGVVRPEHRDLIELCSLVRCTTESLIAEVLGPDSAPELFAWLRGLSFIEETPFGLTPHDLARDTIAAEVRWRNPDRYSDLHHKARSFYADRLERATGSLQQSILFDYIFLHRDSPMVKPFFEWNAAPRGFIDSARPDDEAAIVEMVAKHEGEQSARIAAYWMRKQPGGFLVVRSSDVQEGIVGLLGKVRLDLEDAEDGIDPAIVAARQAIRQSPLREGEIGFHFRFWMSAESYQAVGPIQSLIFVAIVQHNFAVPTPAITMIGFSQPDFWTPMFDYALHRRLPDGDAQIGDRQYGVFAMDWRSISPKKWLDLLREQEAPLRERSETPRMVNEVLVLSKESFSRCIHEALKSFSNQSRLAESPLLESRLVIERVTEQADVKAKVQILREVILDAAKTLNDSPRDSKLFKALDAGYLRPKRSQEFAAEVLDISIASFRRHLKLGVERLTGVLWQQETGL